MSNTNYAGLITTFFVVTVSLVGTYFIGSVNGQQNERNRLIERCLTEHNHLSFKEVTQICKERVK